MAEVVNRGGFVKVSNRFNMQKIYVWYVQTQKPESKLTAQSQTTHILTTCLHPVGAGQPAASHAAETTTSKSDDRN